jgi:hypothetical protein
VVLEKAVFPRHITLSDSKAASKYRCPVSLSVLHQPSRIVNTDHVFSGPILAEMTKTCKEDPFSGAALIGEWQEFDYKLDGELSQQMVSVQLANGGGHG